MDTRPFSTVVAAGLVVVTLGSLLGCEAPAPTSLFQEEGYHAVKGTSLYYEVLGTGEPIVVVHGGPGLDHSYFLPQLEPLAQTHRLIFYDQRVSGRSSANVDSSTISLQHFVEDLDGIREAFGLERMHVLAHSWGGLLAMRYAILYPERVQSLVLVNTVAASAALAQAANANLMTRMTSADSLARVAAMTSEAFQQRTPAGIASVYRANFRLSFFDPTLVDSLTLTFPPDFVQRSTLLRHLGPSMATYDLHPDLHRITSPTLLLHTDYDGTPASAIARIHEALPNAERITLDRCGHFPFVECPAPFFEAVQRFLNQHKSSP